MKESFLEKYFPATKQTSLKKDLSNIEQDATESLYEYYERFKRLVASCPYHGYSENDLIFYLYEYLLPDERRMLNAACGGSIMNKTPKAAFEMIGDLSEESRQFNTRSGSHSTRAANAVNVNSSSNSEIQELKDIMRQFMLASTKQHVKACGI